jgi:hypothetical protein
LKLRIQELLAKTKLTRLAHGKIEPTDNGPILRFFANLGPGLITGAADDDPSGISTYSVAGAAFGYASLWTALFSLPLMASVQLIAPGWEWLPNMALPVQYGVFTRDGFFGRRACSC